MTGLSAASKALQSAYRQNGSGPVAYLDETFQVETSGPTYYVMTAAVVEADQCDIVRAGIRQIVGSTYWHTTEALQSQEGRIMTRELLDYLGDPSGTEVCFVAHERQVAPNDTHGEQARAACMTSLLAHLSSPSSPAGQVELFVLEKRLTNRMANMDARTKNEALRAGLISPRTRLFQTSPSDEQLLWIPDLVCSAYRHQITGRTPDLFPRVSAMCTLLP